MPTEGTRYVQALLLTATAYLQYRAHFLPAVAAYRGYGRPAVPKVPVQALRACLAIGHGTLPLPSVAWSHTLGAGVSTVCGVAWEVGTGISSGIWGSGDLGLVSVECCKERVLERRVLGRLLEVIMHLASRREDTLHSCR